MKRCLRITMGGAFTLFCTTAYADSSGNAFWDMTSGVIWVIVAILVAIGAILIIIGIHSSVKDKIAVSKEKRRIQETVDSRLGVVITSYQVGHLEKFFHADGTFSNMRLSSSNNVNGWSMWIGFINSTGKTIKYVTFNVLFLNRVNDPAESELDGRPLRRLEYTGPLSHGKADEGYWENMIYSKDLDSFRIESIEVKYMDGTEETIDRKDVVFRT